MKPIRVIEKRDGEYYDCKRMVQILAERGYAATIEQARDIWSKHSETMAAGWLGLPDDDASLFMEMSPYFEVEEDNDDA